MSDYVILFRYTKEGLANIKDIAKRIKQARDIFAQNGANAKFFYGLLGQYDTMCIAEAPNDETIAKISLQIGALGKVRCETLPAFSEDKFVELVNKLPS